MSRARNLADLGSASLATDAELASEVSTLNTALTAKLDASAYEPGLVLVSTVNFSSSSSVELDNVFDSTYDAYRIRARYTQGTSPIHFQMRSGGANTASNYHWMIRYTQLNASATTVTQSSLTAQTSGWFGDMSTTAFSGSTSVDVTNPALSTFTHLDGLASTTQNSGASWYQFTFTSIHGASTVFDGIRIFPTSGTISGQISVYGYRK